MQHLFWLKLNSKKRKKERSFFTACQRWQMKQTESSVVISFSVIPILLVFKASTKRVENDNVKARLVPCLARAAQHNHPRCEQV